MYAHAAARASTGSSEQYTQHTTIGWMGSQPLASRMALKSAMSWAYASHGFIGMKSIPRPALAAMGSVCGLPQEQYIRSTRSLDQGRGRTDVSAIEKCLPSYVNRSRVSAIRTTSRDSMNSSL